MVWKFFPSFFSKFPWCNKNKNHIVIKNVKAIISKKFLYFKAISNILILNFLNFTVLYILYTSCFQTLSLFDIHCVLYTILCFLAFFCMISLKAYLFNVCLFIRFRFPLQLILIHPQLTLLHMCTNIYRSIGKEYRRIIQKKSC